MAVTRSAVNRIAINGGRVSGPSASLASSLVATASISARINSNISLSATLLSTSDHISFLSSAIHHLAVSISSFANFSTAMKSRISMSASFLGYTVCQVGLDSGISLRSSLSSRQDVYSTISASIVLSSTLNVENKFRGRLVERQDIGDYKVVVITRQNSVTVMTQ